jgi:hypothetical protein
MSKTDSVWHYTTAQGLHSIVTGNVFWATSHRFMNDSQESNYATTALRSAADQVRGRLNPMYVERFDKLMGYSERNRLEAFLLCAARKSDLLTVWRGYGSEVPYAIELDAGVDLLPVAQKDATEHPTPPAGWEREEYDKDDEGRPIYGPDPDDIRIEIQTWTKVLYDSRKAEDRVAHIARLAGKDPSPVADAIIPWNGLGGIDLLQMKHPAFKDEREARMVFEVNPRWKFVKHRSTRFGLTPYIEVSTADDENQRAANDRFVTAPGKSLPIRSVHIGPSPLGDESINALREFLEFNGYPDIPIEKSQTPFR